MAKIRRMPFKSPFTPKFQTPLLKQNNDTSISISSLASTASGCNDLHEKFKLYTFIEPPEIKIQKNTSSGQVSDHETRLKATGVSTNRFRPKKSFKSPLVPALNNNAPGTRKGKDKIKIILDEIFPSPPKAKQSIRHLAYEAVKQDVLKTIYKMKRELEEIRERRQMLFIDSRTGINSKAQGSKSLKYRKSSENVSLAVDTKANDAYQGGNATEDDIFAFFEE